MSFRDNLVHLRAVNNMTQEQLAMRLNVSRQSVAKWEAGKSSPEMDKLLSLCQIFNCTLDELVQGDLTGKEADESLVMNSTLSPVDVYGYEDMAKTFANKIGNGVMAILLGLAISCVFYVPADSWKGQFQENLLVSVATLCLFAGIGFGLSLIIPASLTYNSFVKEHPYLQDFFTPEQKDHTRSVFVRELIGGICCIFVGICIMIAVEGLLPAESFVIPVFLAFVAVGVRFIVHGGITVGIIDLDSYNKSAGAHMDEAEIEELNFSPERKRQLMRAHNSEKKVGAVCGAIMVVATIAGLSMLFIPGIRTSYFWLAWVFGGLLCAVASIAIKGFEGKNR